MRSTIDHRPDDIRDTEELINKLKGPEAVFFGLDVGRAVDHSALSALVRYILPVEANNTLMTRYYCVHLHRYPLGTYYEEVEEDVKRWWNWADITGMRRYFIMDMTGVGAPVYEGIKRKGVRTIGVTITGGERMSNPQIDQYNVPKVELTTQLVRIGQVGRFKGYPSLANWKDLMEEVNSFGYKMNKDTSAMTYESLDAKVHDDLVISVALPIWYGERVMPYRVAVRSSGATIGDMDYNPLEKPS